MHRERVFCLFVGLYAAFSLALVSAQESVSAHLVEVQSKKLEQTAALAGELSRNKGGRWVETDETPVPFALKFPKGELAHPAKLAQKIVEGDESSLAE